MKKIAVDTNILSRLMADVPGPESRYAESLLGRAGILVLVSTSVLLETEWVLRSGLGIKRADVVRMMQALLEIEHVEFEQREQIIAAVGAFAEGMDFADALHVVTNVSADAFVTFDRDLVKFAQRHIKDISVELAQ